MQESDRYDNIRPICILPYYMISSPEFAKQSKMSISSKNYTQNPKEIQYQTNILLCVCLQ